MSKILIEGIVLGLTTGLSCMGYCLPVLYGLNSRNVNERCGLRNTVYLLIGRLIAYLLVAVVFSVLGMRFKGVENVKTVFKIISGLLLIYWGVRGFVTTDKNNGSCVIKKMNRLLPILMGLLTGISPCPPFFAGVARVTAMGDVSAGVIYFSGFFITTSMFLLPGFITGIFQYRYEIKIITSVFSTIFGCFFIYSGILIL